MKKTVGFVANALCLGFVLSMPVVTWSQVSPEVNVANEPRLILGNDAVIAPPRQKEPLKGAPTSFKFEEAPIVDFATLVLKDVLKVDYVLHQPLVGAVTMSTGGEVSADQAMLLLEAALQANGLTIIQDTRGTFHVGKPDTLKGIIPALRQVSAGSVLPPGTGAIVVRLRYIGASEMASILRPLLGPDSLIRVDNTRNLLVLAGSRTQAEGWLDVISTFDVNMLKGMSVGVFPLKYATVTEVEAALRLFGGGAPRSATNSMPGQAGNSSTPQVAQAESVPFLGAVRVMPIERLNSVLVVSSSAAYLDEAKIWIERLDKPGANSSDSQLFIYPVQNGSAKHLAVVIGSLFGGSAPATTPGSSGVSPGLTAATAATAGAPLNSQGGNSIAGVTGGAGQVVLGGALNSRPNAQGVQSAPTAVSIGQGAASVRIVADEINNAVLFYGTRSEFNKVEAALKRLDLAPTQVMIEASIIEVSLTDDLEYGLQWLFNGGAPGRLNGTGAISSAANGVLGAAKAGFSYTMTNTAGNVRAVLNALADKSLVKVISSPSLMVLDNHTANITVGNQQPVQTATTIITGGPVSNSIQYKDTGVSLTVTPSVTAGNMVSMQLNQTVTDVGAIDVATGQRVFLQRQINSKVAVRSGENLVLGGLIRDNTTSGSSGLPLLSAIPVVGGLFGTQKMNSGRTELLVVLSPRVLRADQDMRDIGQEMRERMGGLKLQELSTSQRP